MGNPKDALVSPNSDSDDADSDASSGRSSDEKPEPKSFAEKVFIT
jgi:hypothetical protein